MLEQSFKMLPHEAYLEKVLSDIFSEDINSSPGVKLLNRLKNDYSSTHASEIVTCLLPGGEKSEIFIKYEIGSYSFINHHRKNLLYEIQVYKSILSLVKMSTPVFYGSHLDPDNNQAILVLSTINDFVKFSKGPQPETILNAACWLANFHRQARRYIQNDEISFLHRYDRDYFLFWAKQTEQFIYQLKMDSELAWILEFISTYTVMINDLMNGDPTVIHGEFYPQNVLYSDGVIHPVDWQTAAVGAGEIDLAALTDGWSKETVDRCLEKYYQVCNINGSYKEFIKRVFSAWIYFKFRWLGNNPESILHETWCIEQLKLLINNINIYL